MLAEDAVERACFAREAAEYLPHDPLLQFRCLYLAGAPGEELRKAAEALPPNLGAYEAVQPDHALWKATGNPEDLARARAGLERLVQSAPKAMRSAMREGLALYRDLR